MNKNELKIKLETAKNEKDFFAVIEKSPQILVAELLWNLNRQYHTVLNKIEEIQNEFESSKSKSGFRTRCVGILDDNSKILIHLGGVQEEVVVSPGVDKDKLQVGVEVLIQGAQSNRIVVAVREDTDPIGNIGIVSEVLDDRIILNDNGKKTIVRMSDELKCREGSSVCFDPISKIALEVIEENDMSDYDFTETPKFSFDDIGGLNDIKQYLREKIIYPIIYKDKFKKYGIFPIKGCLLHGPPGCGKNMLAGAVFSEMIKLKQEKEKNNKNINSGFFVINGPECLNMWVGKQEESIRELFSQARKTAEKTGFPSIIFWDELESVAGSRRDSPSYNPEKTIVPTLLTELEGLEESGDVIFIGASNRPDLIDDALLRPGRLGDAIIEIPRPTKLAAIDILNKHLRDIPIELKIIVENNLVNIIIDYIYNKEKPLIKYKIKNNYKTIFREDIINGSILAQIIKDIRLSACMFDILQNGKNITLDDIPSMIDKILLSYVKTLSSKDEISHNVTFG